MRVCVCICVHVCLCDSLVDGLQELPLVLADPGMVDLLHELGVLVDEPRLPQHISRRVLYLRSTGRHGNHVSLEHIPKSLSPTGRIDSAPREFAVYVSLRHPFTNTLRQLIS